MASSGGVFSKTLQSITTTKLNELSKKRKVFENQKTQLLRAADREIDQKTKLRILVDGVKKAFSLKTSIKKRGFQHGGTGQIIYSSTNNRRLEILIKNLERFLAQAQYDPSVSAKLLHDWESSLNQQLNITSLRYQYATLYGELVTEWLSLEQKHIQTDADPEMKEDFEHVRREEQLKDEGRAEWEKHVFHPYETDQGAIADYLSALFEHSNNKAAIKALAALRFSVEAFESSLSVPNQFTEEVLRWTIHGLLTSGLLPDEKTAALKDFLMNSVILSEVADVLNMRLAALDDWEWEADGLPVEQRRHVTGKYHIYIEEDLLQAIFLQFIGIKWSVFFKSAFIEFSQFEDAWKSLRTPITKDSLERREWFLGKQDQLQSVQGKRQALYNSNYFMSQLPDSEYQILGSLEGEEEVDYDSRLHKRSKNDSDLTQSSDVLQDFDFDSFLHSGHDPALQGYQSQLMLLQQQNNNRVALASAQAPNPNQMAVPLPQHLRQAQMQAQSYALRQAQAQAQAAMQQAQPMYHPQPPMRTQAINRQQKQLQMKPSDDYNFEDPNKKPRSPMETKQFLLHLLSTEMLINTRLHGEFTCVHSEFDAWSPSLPHSTIHAVLSFLGLSEKWLRFFRTFVESPLKFVNSGISEEPRIRKRGVPGAHALSNVCAETVLFCMDYAVNQKTNGQQLYRMHDDFWIFSPSHETVVAGWEAITDFTKVMGVHLNYGKSGSVRIHRDKDESGMIHPSLPKGDIRWGFLHLDPVSGHFIIDQGMVDIHIAELKRQLLDKKSIFSWIQVFNTFASRFFTFNFGKPANCFGRQHVDSMLESLERIQRSIFSDKSVIDHLKMTIQDRFGILDIPDGYFYFPANLGGLELHNPFIGLVQLRDSVYGHPESALDCFFKAEEEAYQKAKIAYETGKVVQYNVEKPPGNLDFMSYEEFSRYREEFYSPYEGNLYSVFNELLQQPGAEIVDVNETDLTILNKYPSLSDGYWRWVAQLYGPDMIERFGGLHIVDDGLLPIGMVNLFREGKVKWQG